jgi:glycosyltransferase involved in cell wall biosynthesis
MAPTISVIICTHNPREDYLRRTLKALEKQTLPKDQWELLLIDNASTAPLQEKWNLSWHPHSRHILETELGLTAARLRGIRESKGEILVFVDDDCELSLDYLEVSIGINHRHPALGAWSGQCFPVFELDPPEWSRPYWGHLTVRRFDKERWSNIFERDLEMPWGAGLYLRREAAQAYLRKTTNHGILSRLDRRGGSLMSCGDLAMVFCCRDVGMGFGIFPQLQLNHLIPCNRLSEDYFVKIIRGTACSWILLQYAEGYRNIPAKIGWVRSKLGQWRRWLSMPRRERLFFEARLAGQQEAGNIVRKMEKS